MSQGKRPAKPRNQERKNPKQTRSQNMVEAILLAATRVLSNRELDEVSTNLIAETAGASIGSFYQYFPNKESLAVSLMERFLGDDESLLKVFESSDADDLDIMTRKYLDAFFDHSWQHRHMLRVLGKHVFRLKLFEAIVAMRLHARDHLAAKLVARIGASREDANEIAWVLVAAVAGVLEAVAFTDLDEKSARIVKQRTGDMLAAYVKSEWAKRQV